MLWKAYLQKWWSSSKHPVFFLPTYMQLNGDKQLFPYIFTLPEGEQEHASRNMICGSLPSYCTKVFPLFIALYFISTIFFLGYLPFLFVCPSLPVGISTVPYKDLIWYKLFEAEQHDVELIRQLNLARGVPLLQVLRDTIHWLCTHMGI